MSQEGTYVGKYLIKSKIAEGGMGAIYKAKHPTLGRTVILKRLTLKKNTAITERFKREAQLMIDFRHDNIVQVYDHFKEGNSYYIVMEFVDGISLGDLIEKKRYFPNETAMVLFREICKALKYAHDKNVIHRDIKPENILISNDGEVKLTDFGIATSKDSEEEGLTSAGMTLGTPAYMSPEQIADTKRVDKRADIYSMGVVFYKMVTGKTPFPGNFTPEATAQINKGEYLYPRKINPRITPLIQKVIKKAMHHKPKRRYKDLQQIIDLFSKELKKKYKNKETINAAIKAYMQGKEAVISGKSQKSDTILGKAARSISTSFRYKLGRMILIILIIGILASIGAYYAYLKGMHYEYLYSDEYGAIIITMKVRTRDKDPGNDFIKANLYEYNDKKFVEIQDIDFNFRLKEDGNDDYFTLESKKIYLKSSYYRILVNYGNEQFQRDFLLDTRTMQKVNKDTYDSERIQFLYSRVLHLPLKVDYSVYDTTKRKDITGETDFEIYAGSRWLAWERFLRLKNYSDILVTGKTHRFRFKKDDYYTELRRIYVKPEETVLSLDINLFPRPGNLLLNSNHDGLEILLNNSFYYISGTRYSSYLKMEPSSQKQQSYLLSPGDYFITVRRSGDNTKTIKASIESRKSTIVNIDYNKDNDSIELEM